MRKQHSRHTENTHRRGAEIRRQRPTQPNQTKRPSLNGCHCKASPATGGGGVLATHRRDHLTQVTCPSTHLPHPIFHTPHLCICLYIRIYIYIWILTIGMYGTLRDVHIDNVCGVLPCRRRSPPQDTDLLLWCVCVCVCAV